ncbi:sideroflexin-1-3 isoform X2 [Drosophila santomea]|uniref:sideroflexin-1-3 isoform X2 n=1 Tax=Drosophila santomea TaxID=129105 RepID=UPI0019531382|nr:sideroflexin-1-3 isoform X2 [Drosophila santomea]
MSPLPRVNIDEPKYDQNSYLGRAKHFFLLTNPLNVLASDSKLEEARQIVLRYRAGCSRVQDHRRRVARQIPVRFGVPSGDRGEADSHRAHGCANAHEHNYYRRELRNGVTLFDEHSNEMGISKKAAVVGISTVILSRIAMAIPGMTLTPVLMNVLEKRGFLAKYPRSNAPIQTLFCGFVLLFATPLGCAFFKQRADIEVDSLESEVRDTIRKKRPDLETVWFNKGL